MSHDPVDRSRLRAWLSTIPAVILLVLVILHGTGEKVHARLLQIGEDVWPGYASLRVEPVKPTCDVKAKAAPAKPAKPAGGDDFLNDLMGSDTGSAAADAQAQAAARKQCEAQKAQYRALMKRITPSLRAYRSVETAFAAFVALGVSYLQQVLVLLLLICAATATAIRAHIGLRSVHTRRDDRYSEVAQLAANLLLLLSSFYKWRIDVASGVAVQNHSLPYLWMAGFAVMSVINVVHLVRPSPAHAAGGSRHKALLAVPLYATMGLISGLWFFVFEHHPSGLAIYLQKLTEHALIYIHVGLYVWAGMLLKRTRLADLSFDLVRPWKLPAELLAFVVVAAAAIPTAYSGASGIFVIAAGAVIYEEMIRAGARKQLALATTAMSGSLGVVLAPCLLVVIVASLNKQVTTDQLYHWGWRVFALTSILFLIASLLVRRGPLNMASPREAMKGTWKALRPLAPYLVVVALVLGGYGLGLGTALDEHTAPVILPVLLLLLLVYDRRAARRDPDLKQAPDAPVQALGYRAAVVDATRETTGHIGALLSLMGLSVCVGGIIERSDVVALGAPALRLARWSP